MRLARRPRARRSVGPVLPPGPGWPMPLQSLAWMRRHGPYLRRCHARYGDIFTLRLAYEGNVVILAHPDAVREVFTGDPSVVHAGEASAVLRPIVGRESLLVLDDRP